MHVEHRDEDGKFEIWVTYPWRTECWCAAGWLVSLPPWIAFSVLKKNNTNDRNFKITIL
jgi:hypothetical protein